MRNLIRIGFFAIILMFVIDVAHASDRRSLKSKERMISLMKVKLIEHLDLDEELSTKLLVKYSAMHKDMMKGHKKIRKFVNKLNRAIQNKASEEKLKLMNQELIEMHRSAKQKKIYYIKEFQKILPTVEFSKFLVFEHEIRKQIRDAMRHKGPPHRERGRGRD